MPQPTDKELVRRVRRGDREAMGQLVDRHYAPVLNFVARFVGRTESAHDLAQETFVKVIRRLESFDDRADLRTWIFAIAANACRDEMRRAKRRPELTEADGPDLQLIRDFAEDTDVTGKPAAMLDRKLRADQVRRAVASLSDLHREVVVLRFFHDLSLKEIAEICHCSIGTVGSRLHYAVKRLARELAPESGDAGGIGDEVLGDETAPAGTGS